MARWTAVFVLLLAAHAAADTWPDSGRLKQHRTETAVRFAGVPADCMPCPEGTFANATVCDCELEGTCPTLDLCTACSPGTYTDRLGASECTPCLSGEYQPDRGQTGCIACSPGHEQPLEGSAYCDECGIGFEAPSNGTVQCSQCLNGTVAEGTGTIKCDNCTLGSTSWFPFDQCYLCSAGTFCSDIPCVECQACPPGSHQAREGQSDCELCPYGSYQMFEGQSFCSSCGRGYFLPFQGSNSSVDCQPCAEGSYNPDPEAMSCLLCPEDAYCPAGASEPIVCGVLFQPQSNGGCTPSPSLYIVIIVTVFFVIAFAIVGISYLRRRNEEPNETDRLTGGEAPGPTYSGL